MDKTKEVIIYKRDGESLKINFQEIDTRINYMEHDRELVVTFEAVTELYTLKKEMSVIVENVINFYNDLIAMDDILVGKALLNNGQYSNDFILTVGSDKRTGFFEYTFEITQYDRTSPDRKSVV